MTYSFKRKHAAPVCALGAVLFSVTIGLPLRAAETSTSKAPATEAAALPARSARQIIDDALQAFGGVENFKKAKDRAYHAKGKVLVISGISGGTNSFDCDMLGKKDKQRVETSVLGQKSISGYDGTVSWGQSGDWVSRNSPTVTARIADEVKHGFEALLDSLASGAHTEALPPRTIAGRLYEVVRIDHGSGATTIYFDPVSHLVARAEFLGEDPEQGHSVLKGFEYSDYKLVDGIPTPFTSTEYSADKKVSETVMESIDVKIDLPDSVFAMPPESSVTALSRGPVTIPFEYAENEILIRVRIGDTEYPVVVDTGASTTVLDPKVTQGLGAANTGTFTVTSGRQSMPLHYLTVPNITIGDITLHDISALVSDLSALGLGMKKAPVGIIGANILKRFLVTFDYTNKKIILSDPTKVAVAENAIVLPTSPAFGSTALVVAGKLNGNKAVNFLVDTGAAFNNLPPALAKDYYSGSLLQVGKIAGLDGKPVSMCSLRLDTLQLGSLTIANPVFATVPGGSAPAGLVNASSMGILGNPLWSQFKVTLDYRNEKLLLEVPAGKRRLDETAAKLEKLHRQYLHDKKLETAAAAYEDILSTAQSANAKDLEALATSYIAATYDQRNLGKPDQKWLVQSLRLHSQAAHLAGESGNKRLEALILSRWAASYLRAPAPGEPDNESNLSSADKLLRQALATAPMEPNVYAVMGAVWQKSGKKLVAERLIDQALLLDPDNWLALWTKLSILQELHQPEIPLVVAQLQRYYGDVPEVQALAAGGSSNNKAADKPGR